MCMNMRLLMLILCCFVSSPVLAGISNDQQKIEKTVSQLLAFNDALGGIESGTAHEAVLNQLLEEQISQLDQLMTLLKRTSVRKLPKIGNERQLSFFQSRITVNQERGNEMAVLRDQLSVEYLNASQAINRYIEYLIEASNRYKGIQAIVVDSQKALNKSQKVADLLPLPESKEDNQITVDVRKNYQQFTRVNTTYQDILKYVINNPRKIASIHWFQQFSLLSAISYINNFDGIRAINYKLIPFNVDIGGISLSFVIIALVYFSYPLFFRFTNYLIKKYVSDDEDHQDQNYQQVVRPIRMGLMFFGIDLATYAFFYKADYRSVIESMSFVIFSLIFVWLLLCIINIVVMVHLKRLTRINKDLRKELVALGVQVVKAIIIIVVMAVVLSHFGINITAILSTLGIGGLAFALAAKDTLSNLFGGITILFDNVYRMGDWVKIEDVEGTVSEIGLRSTTIRTFDNALIVIPNAVVSVSSVRNMDRRVVGRRIKMYVGVTYESNMEDIRKALDDIREMLKTHPDIANPTQQHRDSRKKLKLSSHEDSAGIKSTQLVFMDRYNDFSIDILIYCFSKTVDWAKWLAVKEDVLFKIAAILKNNHLEFAYPTEVRIHRNSDENESPEYLTQEE